MELLPLPLTPVDQHQPPLGLGDLRQDRRGSRSDSMVGTVNGMTRITIMNDERCRSTLTRNRPTPGMPHEQSKSLQRSIRPRSLVVSRHQLERDGPGLVGREPLLGERHQLAVDARAEHVARLDVQVGRAPLDRRLDDFFHEAVSS